MSAVTRSAERERERGRQLVPAPAAAAARSGSRPDIASALAGLQRQYGNRALANALQRANDGSRKAVSVEDFDDPDDFAEEDFAKNLDDEAVSPRTRRANKARGLRAQKRASPAGPAARKRQLRAQTRANERDRQAKRKREHLAQDDERLAQADKVLAEQDELRAQRLAQEAHEAGLRAQQLAQDAELFDRSTDMYAEAELLILYLVRDRTHQQCLERVDEALDIHKELERKSPGKRDFGPLFTLWQTIITDVQHLLTQQEQEQRKIEERQRIIEAERRRLERELEERDEAERQRQVAEAKERDDAERKRQAAEAARLTNLVRDKKKVTFFRDAIIDLHKKLDAVTPPKGRRQEHAGLKSALFLLEHATVAGYTGAQDDSLKAQRKTIDEFIAGLRTAQTPRPAQAGAKRASPIPTIEDGDPRLNGVPRGRVHKDALAEAPSYVATLRMIFNGTAESRSGGPAQIGHIHHGGDANNNVLWRIDTGIVLGFVLHHMEKQGERKAHHGQAKVVGREGSPNDARNVAIIDNDLFQIV